MALRYRSASRTGKKMISDELFLLTCWNRDYNRKQLWRRLGRNLLRKNGNHAHRRTPTK